MTNSENLGLTAREAAEEYCLRWTWAGYLGAWRNNSASDIKKREEEREEARQTISDELKAMLCLAFKTEEETASKDVPQVEARKNRILRSGKLPTQRGKACETPIIAGLLNSYHDGLPNEICFLRVTAQGDWVFEEREGAFLDQILGEDPKIAKAQFIVTREDFATCELTFTIEVSEAQKDNGDGKRMVKHATWVDSKTGPWISNVDDPQKAINNDFLRKRSVGDDVWEGPEPRPLRIKGRPGKNKPLVKLGRDDIRDFEINIEKNRIYGGSRKFGGLRFWLSDEEPQQEAEAVLAGHEDGESDAVKSTCDEDKSVELESPAIDATLKPRSNLDKWDTLKSGTQDQYARWFKWVPDAKTNWKLHNEGDPRHPQLVAEIIKLEVGSGQREPNAGTVERRLDEYFLNWAD